MLVVSGVRSEVSFRFIAKSAAKFQSTSRSRYSSRFFSVSGMANVVKVDRDYHVPDPYRRGKIGRFLTNFTKFTVDFAVNVSFKGVVGGRKLYKIVQEGFKNQPPSCSLNDRTNSNNIESVEEMQAKIEEMQEDVNIVKQQNTASAKLSERSKPEKKIPNEDIKGLDLLRTNEKRVFIRSRL